MSQCWETLDDDAGVEEPWITDEIAIASEDRESRDLMEANQGEGGSRCQIQGLDAQSRSAPCFLEPEFLDPI